MTTHDEMAFEIARIMRDNVVSGKRPWSNQYGSSIVITSSSGWPVPDFIFDDRATNITHSFEFKPPDQTRREYILGLGQALSYLNHFSYASLIVPEESQNFLISEYLEHLIINASLKIGLISYEPDDLSALKIRVPNPRIPPGPLQRAIRPGKVFWAFWMDQSVHEFYLMLKESYELRSKKENIQEEVFQKVFNMMIEGKTYNNSGRLRKLRKNIKFSSWFLNYRLPFIHCNLWTSEGKLTLIGNRIKTIGDTYGWDSIEFRNALSRAYLEKGKHLLLMKYIWNIQIESINKRISFRRKEDFLNHLANELLNMGFGRSLRGVRRNLQAMESLWGGGLRLLRKRGNSYYFPNFGFIFDWGKITSILTSDYW
jgi:hypothetical protein